MARSQELITGEPPNSGLIFWAPHLFRYSNCFNFYGRLLNREKLFFKVVFCVSLKRVAIFITFRAQPLGLISSAGTGRVEFARTGWTPRLSLCHILALSNRVSLSGTSQHEPYCKLFFSTFSAFPYLRQKWNRLEKGVSIQRRLSLLLAHYLSVCCLSQHLMAFWAAEGTSIMLNKKKK